MRRPLFSFVLALFLCSGAAQATACPLCKFGNESKQADEKENLRPRAYMYSILFMLAMPASLATALGVGLYRLTRNEMSPVDDSSMVSETEGFSE